MYGVKKHDENLKQAILPHRPGLMCQRRLRQPLDLRRRGQAPGCLRVRPALSRTQRAIGLASETGKRFGFALEPRRFRRGWSGLATPSKLMEQENEKHEESTGERRESQVASHDQPLQSGGQ
jgi:hypothetical protein